MKNYMEIKYYLCYCLRKEVAKDFSYYKRDINFQNFYLIIITHQITMKNYLQWEDLIHFVFRKKKKRK